MKAKSVKMSDSDKVADYMAKLEHPLKAGIEELRKIISNANDKLSERIKWNAPSYYYKEDLITFNPRLQKRIHIIFHHIAIIKIKSALLEGDYKDRRMVYFDSKEDIKAKKEEFSGIVNKLVQMMDE